MSKRHKQLKRTRYYEAHQDFFPINGHWVCENPKCQHKGCDLEGVECRLVDGDGEMKEYFCGEHAREHGYCRCCGQFWAGVNAFDFNKSGLCSHCQDQVNADFAEPSDDDDGSDAFYNQC